MKLVFLISAVSHSHAFYVFVFSLPLLQVALNKKCMGANELNEPNVAK